MVRAGLSTLRVVEEAEAVADQIGLSNLTLAFVAMRLGVKMPSLYKHIEGMEALQRQVSLRARTELADVLGRAAVGKAGTEALQAMSAAYRRWAQHHPGRYAATQRAPDPQDPDDVKASNAIGAVAFDILAGYGLTGDDAVDAVRALRAALHGFVTLEQAGGFGLPADIDRSFDRLVHALARALTVWTTAPETTAPEPTVPDQP